MKKGEAYMSNIDKSKNYFEIFSKKDLSGLKKMFSKNIQLKDWEIEAKGIEKVLKANKNIFDSVNTIQVTPLKIYVHKNIVIAQLIIEINKNEDLLHVVDIIEFDKSGKILSIRAYKG
tara:strand:- start:374 stop:727 length:354 start_codon:yes stop_codon:yes gene_type:complete